MLGYVCLITVLGGRRPVSIWFRKGPFKVYKVMLERTKDYWEAEGRFRFGSEKDHLKFF